MIISQGKFILDVDIERTRTYYQDADGITCDCQGCRNFPRAVKQLPAAVHDFFRSLGVDIDKPAEIYVHCKNQDNSLFYGGFYHICGSIIRLDDSYVHPLTEAFQIYYQEDCHLLDPNFPRPAFQLEILAHIPWVLPEENTYS